MNDLPEMDMSQRLDYLEQANRFKMQALTLIRELGDFHSSINQLETPDIILEKTRDQVSKLIQFKSMAFFLIDETTSEFHLSLCCPETDRHGIESELECFIEDGTFSRAVVEKIPVTAYARDFKDQFLLHVLTTVSRVRGMFVGVLEKKAKHVPEAAFELFSIVMTHCANGLESFELYRQLKSVNRDLEQKVTQLSVSEACLKKEIKDHKKTMIALGISEGQYRQLSETAHEVILTLSPQGKILYVNGSGLRLSQYSQKQFLQKDPGSLFQDFEKIRHQAKDGRTENHYTFLTDMAGRKIPLEISIVPLKEGDAKTGLLIVGRDISERIRAEKERKTLESKLWQARKMESIGLLAGGTAHDFNNLLTIIINYTDLSFHSLPPGHAILPNLKKIETASMRAVDLAKKLYTIGREDRHETHLVNLAGVIEETLGLLKNSLGKGITLSACIREMKLMVMAEETRIQQVLMNLITNAAHAMGKGEIRVCGEKILLEKGLDQAALGIDPGPCIRMSVTDTGPGIDPGILSQVFDPYFSTKKGGDNAGLGLAVVFGIVKNYQGAIDLKSVKGRGTTFHIYLPEAFG
ncbi:MAG: PAS domain S-box protein [Proteobacteria bacterium]|nr:PAS domain S-box protein [Pseudomonadota bacterium]MBU4132434.1 PAS domain S-box protein [Pseudomonadota bacterium]